MTKSFKRRVLTVVMDGIGIRKEGHGNAVFHAQTPSMEFLKKKGLYTSLKAHGPWVGLPSKEDMGNSEVGHNTIGAGRIYSQGAKLVNEAINNGSIWKGAAWQSLIKQVITKKSCLHLIGLLSDGNVHSHESHLFRLLEQAAKEGVTKIRVHTLLDGRDVPAQSAETYLKKLEAIIVKLIATGCDVKIASGGGRMLTTMDRYEADWSIVDRGWKAHVLGEAKYQFTSALEGLSFFRKNPNLSDQDIPAFVIRDKNGPIGEIKDNDSVILFNFRGDRAIEISKAFENSKFDKFDRVRFPKVNYTGMIQYDGDKLIPKNYLVTPPSIRRTLGEYLCSQGIRQFACSETQKFGHVTYFWNGNKSGFYNAQLETYVEIPSDKLSFERKPWMKAYEITEASIDAMQKDTFDFGRINFANGDMVGHTGDFEAAVIAVATVDAMLNRLILCAQKTKTILIVTADHGNCEEMFEKDQNLNDSNLSLFDRPKGKTSHTLAEVPAYIYDPEGKRVEHIMPEGQGCLANIANTVLDLMGLETQKHFESSLLIKKGK